MPLTAPPAAAGPVPEGSRVEAVAQAGALLAAAFDGVTFGYFDDAEAIAVLAALEGLRRKLDGARLRSTTDIGVRAETDLGNGSLAFCNGCRTRVEFIAQLAGISGREAKRRLKLGESTVERTPMGLPVPARYPVIADALGSGELGLESAEIIATTLTALHGTVLQSDLDHVERALVASATGAITPETAGLPGCRGRASASHPTCCARKPWNGRGGSTPTAPPRADTPHLRPRRVLMASVTMLVGISRRKKQQLRAVAARMNSNMARPLRYCPRHERWRAISVT
ncbi:DUF222 domain-containing protein [Cryobacterium sp. TMT1-3]|uniref:DUF222 domain-containing protein n=1 Tax=Cryobacterium sp. TMT1-3 TaxID=1259237 RepID=UPI00141AD295|nr:DUF222 domain-containing protein [Cryobacterium sp. TMT1-3]